MREIVKRIVIIGMVLDVLLVTVLVVLKRRLRSEGDELSDELGLVAIMEGRELRSRAGAFRGGSMLTLTAGTVLDLRAASLAPEGASLAVRTIMGGTRILVPTAWPVEVRGRALMGGIADQTGGAPAAEGQAPRLVVDVFALCGGVAVGWGRGEAQPGTAERARQDAPGLESDHADAGSTSGVGGDRSANGAAIGVPI